MRRVLRCDIYTTSKNRIIDHDVTLKEVELDEKTGYIKQKRIIDKNSRYFKINLIRSGFDMRSYGNDNL